MVLSSNSALTSVPDDLPKYFPHLHALTMAMCGLTEVPLAFRNMDKIHRIDFSSNLITAIPDWMNADMFDFNMSENQISELPETFCTPRGNETFPLMTLNLMRNSLKTLPTCMGNLKNLFTLDLSNNQLTELPTSLNDLFQLEHIFADSNNITTIPLVKQVIQMHLYDNPIKSFNGVEELHALMDLGVDNVPVAGMAQNLRMYETKAWSTPFMFQLPYTHQLFAVMQELSVDIPRRRATIVFNTKKNGPRLQLYAECNVGQERVSIVRSVGQAVTCATVVPPSEFCNSPSSLFHTFSNLAIPDSLTISGQAEVRVQSPNPNLRMQARLGTQPVVYFIEIGGQVGIFLDKWKELSDDERGQLSVSEDPGFKDCQTVQPASGSDVLHSLLQSLGVSDVLAESALWGA
eukprot:GFYU01063263.1.p1 GENE.GFYU01063263.1~~GFYU01063263.1.p1  ORF type:complete len:458 (+),score=79.39 GFYU01063263.1:161-1375(+)